VVFTANNPMVDSDSDRGVQKVREKTKEIKRDILEMIFLR